VTSVIAPGADLGPTLTIAYDLRYASDHFPGVGTHAFRLLQALLELPGGERYAVIWNPGLVNSRFDFDPLPRHSRVDWIETGAPAIGATTPFWTGRLLRRIRPALYFSPFYLSPWGAGCARVLTLHDVLPLELPEASYARGRLLYRVALLGTKRADAVMTSSEASRRQIVRRAGIAESKVHTVHPGVVAPAPVAGARPRGLPERAFALVVGINKPHKNLETLARAWKRFGPNPPLDLVGAGPEDPRYRGLAVLARQHGASRVTALGRVTEPELWWLYRNATITLFPSLAEGFGFPLLEAQAAGSPVLAADVPVLRELGADAARFVAPREDSEWAAAIRELAGDTSLRRTMADAGRARAAEFRYARTAREYLTVFRNVARPRGEGSPAKPQ
jgi:glycosyltransferase involved in cell wall biosynthesis